MQFERSGEVLRDAKGAGATDWEEASGVALGGVLRLEEIADEEAAGDRAMVKAVFLEQARALVEAGVDGLLVETMRQTSELRVAIEAAVEASEGRVPVVASASFSIETGLMAEGTDAGEVARLAREWGASVVGVNCSDGPMGDSSTSARSGRSMPAMS